MGFHSDMCKEVVDRMGWKKQLRSQILKKKNTLCNGKYFFSNPIQEFLMPNPQKCISYVPKYMVG